MAFETNVYFLKDLKLSNKLSLKYCPFIIDTVFKRIGRLRVTYWNVVNVLI